MYPISLLIPDLRRRTEGMVASLPTHHKPTSSRVETVNKGSRIEIQIATSAGTRTWNLVSEYATRGLEVAWSLQVDLAGTVWAHPSLSSNIVLPAPEGCSLETALNFVPVKVGCLEPLAFLFQEGVVSQAITQLLGLALENRLVPARQLEEFRSAFKSNLL